MRPHDELYHYGVKGMKWHIRRRKEKELDEAITKGGITPEMEMYIRSQTGANAPTIEVSSGFNYIDQPLSKAFTDSVHKDKMTCYISKFESWIAKLRKKPDPNKKYKQPRPNYIK